MRLFSAIGLAAALLAFVPSVALADADYNFTVNVNLQHLSKTFNGQPLYYAVRCTVLNAAGTMLAAQGVDVTVDLNAQGDYKGIVKLSVVSPTPAKSYNCHLSPTTGTGTIITPAMASAQIWDSHVSAVLASGPIP
jgi:hypothetical protein